jgi:DNA polymerase-4
MSDDPRPPFDEVPLRKIIHVDMDAFFASVEQRDNPDLRGKPVAVGGIRERGVVAAASYEARVYGVRSAMPSVTARRKCPDLVFVKPRFEVYKAVSQQIHQIFQDYTPLVEPLSLDEAYLDVTENLKGIASATEVAQAIRARIREVTGLTASAGVSYNKFLAKLASDHNKPDGLFVIRPEMGAAFVASLAVRKFHGIGPATSEKMKQLGIETGADLRARDLPWLERHFGSAGSWYYWISRGVDPRRVRPDRERKSVGAETTFFTDITDTDGAREALKPLITKVWRHCEANGLHGRTVTLKVRFGDFSQFTRSRTGPAVDDYGTLEHLSLALLDGIFPLTKGLRLLGVTLSGFGGEDSGRDSEKAGPAQLSLAL